MKEYRLKQWYPSLPSDWKDVNIPLIVVQRELHYSLHPSTWNAIQIDDFIVARFQVENNPEFWEEIKPKHNKRYEILSLSAGKNIFRKDIFHNGITRWYKEGDFSKNGYYPNLQVGGNYALQRIEIHSIKRLSDGEVFTVGDYTNKGKIVSINIEGEGLVFNGSYNFGLDSLKKSRTLFKTEDGVDIYEGDTFYVLDPETFAVGLPLEARPHHSDDGSNLLYFSSKKVAEEYIFMNTPILSLQDVADNWAARAGGLSFSILKKLVKERLKK